MSTVLTLRTPENLRRALAVRAQAEGKAISELVREILEKALAEPAMQTRVGHLRGRLEPTAETDDSWRRQLRDRNWR